MPASATAPHTYPERMREFLVLSLSLSLLAYTLAVSLALAHWIRCERVIVPGRGDVPLCVKIHRNFNAGLPSLLLLREGYGGKGGGAAGCAVVAVESVNEAMWDVEWRREI